MGKEKGGRRFLPLVGIGLGIVLGLLFGVAADLPERARDLSPGSFLLIYLGMILFLLVAVYLQMILHEAGHLVAGLISGYRFSSFRIASFMLLKTLEGLRWKRFSLAGTGGQCLMIPPDMREDTFPFRFYLLGGVLMNLLTALLSLALYLFLWKTAFLLYFAVAGAVLTAMNGIPLNTGEIVNDGYNVRALGRDGDARKAFWMQLRVNALQTEGLRLRDMPEELFVLPEGADRHNVLVSTIAVFRENRLMDQQELEAARQLIDQLLSDQYTVIGLYRVMLALDRVYIDLVLKGESADVAPLSAPENRAILTQMKRFPSVLRTQYAAALRKEKDLPKAEALKAQFEKVADAYPSPGDLAAERSLMERAERLP